MRQSPLGNILIIWLQVCYFLLLFVVHVLILDPITIKTPLPPGVAPYMYGLYPKLVTLSTSVIVGMLVLAVAFLSGWRPRFRPDRRNLLRWGSFALLFLWVLGTALLRRGDPFLVFHGPISRADGAAVQLMWFALAPLTYLVATVRGFNPRVAVGALLSGGALTACWILLQNFGIEPLKLLNDQLAARHAVGGLGNRGPASAYIAIVLAFVLFNSSAAKPLFGPIVRLPLLALFGAALATMPTRTTWVVLAALLLVWALTRVVTRDWILLRRWMVAFAFSAVGFVAILLIPSGDTERTRVSVADAVGDGSMAYRLTTLRVAGRVITARPLTGYGAGGFKAQLWKQATPPEAATILRLAGVKKEGHSYYQVDEAGHKIYMALDQLESDKVHNYLADYAVESGLPMVLALVLFAGASLLSALSGSGRVGVDLALALLIYIGYGLTWFAIPTVESVVWALLGLALALNR
ncbi:O-antigen ligase family protein [Deinococcus pimensis]|uniref:O-antigen ligase family protein n=1 Tax=Deinococcus pimensis TaxID=309888 RepID=UPI000483990F|nr:O-antigen ligase family protein [Deinococcus pimensis]